MKKKAFLKLIAPLLCVMMSLALFACDMSDSNEESSTSEDISESEDNTETVTYPEDEADNTTDSEPENTAETETETETEMFVGWDFQVEVETGREVRVLQLSDIQILERTDGVDDTEESYKKYVRYVIEKTEPDFIIITGDLVYGKFDNDGNDLLDLINFMDSFKIPWSPVFGNHDNESEMGVDWQCAQLEASPYCLFKQRELTGNGNYMVAITQGGVPIRVFFMLDSNGCGGKSAATASNPHFKGSIGVEIDQLRWYVTTARSIKNSYPNIKISVAMHIQPYVFENAFSLYGYDSELNDYGDLKSPIDLGLGGDGGDFGYLGRPRKNTWDESLYFWHFVKETGTDSIFVGHEHCNSISIVYDGVRLQYGQKSSTYDRANYVEEDGSLTGYYAGQADGKKPLIGGTLMFLSKDGSIKDGRIVLYEE